VLRRIRKVDGLVSPRLDIRFDLSGTEMVVYSPKGRRFLTFEELEAERVAVETRAEQEHRRAEQEHRRAEQERHQRAELEQRLARLAELSRKARRQEATPEELAELDRLEQPPPPTII
jgi:aryl-alcohol dehydrogenase-like predicted oxidoreductase